MGRLAVAAVVCMWAIPVSVLVNRIVPDPYMDEIFHVPQAQKYCNGDFTSWDPMITTPPGLYYLSLAYVSALFPGMFFVQEQPALAGVCSTVFLRSTNVVLAVLCGILIYEIITHLKPAIGDRKATLQAAVLALYPLHWFFTFLYYTDVASLTAVLAMYLACLKKKYLFSALLGAYSVFVRQTNIIWVVFIACTGIIDISLAHQRDGTKGDALKTSARSSRQLSINNNGKVSLTLRKRRLNRPVDPDTHSVNNTSTFSMSFTSGLLCEIEEIVLASWQKKWILLVLFSPFLIVLLAFVAFVFWNGSVVLGAKEAHAVSPHFAQIMYFSLVSVLFSAPLHFRAGQVVDLLLSLWKNELYSFNFVVVAFTSAFLSVHLFSIAHPYLLADNRHYPFYLWRKVINARWSMKYLLVPFYVYSWLSIFHMLGKTQRRIWVSLYFLATAAALVPAPLIEFRYYTIPFYFFMLHSSLNDTRSWLLMGIICTVLNVFTMGMFLFRPFHWSHEPGIQRFIW